MKSKLLALVLALCVLMSLACGASAAMTAGTYSATVSGMHGPLTVQVTVSEDKIESVEVTENVETPGLIDWPMREIPQEVVENQSFNVDTVPKVIVLIPVDHSFCLSGWIVCQSLLGKYRPDVHEQHCRQHCAEKCLSPYELFPMMVLSFHTHAPSCKKEYHTFGQCSLLVWVVFTCPFSFFSIFLKYNNQVLQSQSPLLPLPV